MKKKDSKFLYFLILLILMLSSCSRWNDVSTPPKRVTIFESNVFFEGRWRAISQPGNTVIPKINFAEGRCNRETMRCTETIALFFTSQDKTPMGGNNLWLQTNDYVVKEWTGQKIYAREEAPVNDIELRISLADESIERSSRETKARGAGTANPDIFRQWVLE